MTESQADRLKRELRFLKESYEAGIISEEEYKKGKKRIDGKLAEWGEGVVEEYKDEPKEESAEEETDKNEEEAEEEIDDRQEKLKIYEGKKEAKKEQKKEEELTEYSEDDEEDEEEGKEKKKSSIWKIISITAIAVIIILLFINQGRYSINTDLAILNDKNCNSCDTRSAQNVIDNLFPGLIKEEIDYNTKQGKAIYNDLGITYLPAYIFKSSIEQTDTWQKNLNIRDSFEKRKEYYILKPDQTDSRWKP